MSTSLDPLAGGAGESGAPSVATLIADSIASPENTGATALDDVRADLRAEIAADLIDPAPVRRRRGRPRKNDGKRKHVRTRNLELAKEPAAAPSAEAPARAPRKAELAEMLAATQSELAAARARDNPDRVAELAKSLNMIAVITFGFVAQHRGNHWALSVEEAKSIGDSGAVALAPHAEVLNANLPWLAACTTLATVVFQRVQIDREGARQLTLA